VNRDPRQSRTKGRHDETALLKVLLLRRPQTGATSGPAAMAATDKAMTPL